MSFSRWGDWVANYAKMNPLSLDPRAIDLSFRRVLLLSKLFTDSWGHPKTLKQLAKHRRQVMSQRKVVEMNESLNIDMVIEKESVSNGVRTLEGVFRSPHAVVYPEQLPGPLQWAKWKGLFPVKERRGLCVHMAGTGDHSYFRREFGMANSLLANHGIASILIQNPFYTDRKPPNQFRSSLVNVSDLFVMGAALMSECNYLLTWAKKEGYSPIVFSGVSMGGYMASLAASNAPEPVGVVPILSWTTAGPPYTEGAIAPSINYEKLQSQLEDSNYLDKLREIPDVTWVDEMYELSAKNKKPLAYNMMRILMDEFTSMSNYPTPLDTSLCHAVIAEHDAYVIRSHGAPSFKEVWPGMTVETMEGVGHVLGYVQGHGIFTKAIAEVARKAGN